MARGGKRSYVRDGNGRFASSPGGGGGKARPAARRAATRAGNRLNRDNAGRISGIGRDGATVRGGRIKTAKGARRATQTASLKAGGFRGGTIAKGGRGVSGSVARSLAAAKRERAARPGVKAASTAKSYGRGVDTAKVGRIMQRLQATKKYQGASSRVQNAKSTAGSKTQQRAIDFLHKAGGFKKAGTSMGRTRWESPAGLTREQAMRNIAAKIPKQPRRSTAKTGNRKLTTRADKRAQQVAARNAVERSVFFQRSKPAATPTTLKQGYDGSTGRGRKTTADAAARQSSRRQVVRSLRGLGRYNSTRAKRSTAKQLTVFGGRQTTFGRARVM